MFAYSIERVAKIEPTDRFVHYTSFDVAKKIIEEEPHKRSLWLRNSQGMNDFSEVSHVLTCLEETLSDWRLNNRFMRSLEAVKPGLNGDIIFSMMMSAPHLADRAYLTSLSLHNAQESLTGKLSMWRAYGGTKNVCLVFNTQPFVTPQTAWELVLSPVLYGGIAEFKREFEAFVQRLERCATTIAHLDIEIIKSNIARALDFAVLSTKHAGFHEEAEWRIIHQHSEFRGDPPSSVERFGEKEEKAYHVPFVNNEKHGAWGYYLEEALDRIIIGSVENPSEVKDEIIELLKDNTALRVDDIVVECGIPFRRN